MTAIAELAQQTVFERARAAAFSSHATLNDVIDLLDRMGRARLADLVERDDVDDDMKRAMALGTMQGLAGCLATTLRQFDRHTRCAPPEALKDVVAEALQPCCASWNGCDEDVAPWEDMAHDSVDCKNSYLRSVGE